MADRLGGRTLPQDRPASTAPGIQISARIDDVNVTILAEREALIARRPPTLVTRVRAAALGASGFRLRVAPECGWEALGKTLGVRDILVGDELFDDAYVISTSNEDLASAWLSEPIRRGIEDCAPYRFELIDGEIRATLKGLEDDAGRLETVAKQVVSFSGEGKNLLRAARTLAAEIGGLLSAREDQWEPDGGVLIVVERAGCQVLVDWVLRLDMVSGGERVYTRVRARALDVTEILFVIHGQETCEPSVDLAWLPLVAEPDSSFANHFTLLSDASEEIADHLSTALRKRIIDLRPALVTGDGREVSVMLVGLIQQPQPILDAIELALELSTTEASTPYR